MENRLGLNLKTLLDFFHPLAQGRHVLFQLLNDGCSIGGLSIEIVCQGDRKLFVSVDLLLLRVDLALVLVNISVSSEEYVRFERGRSYVGKFILESLLGSSDSILESFVIISQVVESVEQTVVELHHFVNFISSLLLEKLELRRELLVFFLGSFELFFSFSQGLCQCILGLRGALALAGALEEQ
jgi:hypothetical protein